MWDEQHWWRDRPIKVKHFTEQTKLYKELALSGWPKFIPATNKCLCILTTEIGMLGSWKKYFLNYKSKLLKLLKGILYYFSAIKRHELKWIIDTSNNMYELQNYAEWHKPDKKEYIFIWFHLFIYLLKILFIYSWETQRERQRHRQREKQAPYRESNVGLDPGSPNHTLGRRRH